MLRIGIALRNIAMRWRWPPPPPAGMVYLVDGDGAYLRDSDGAFLVEAI